MKKNLSIIICAIFLTTIASAQIHNYTHDYGRSEINLSYGISAVPLLIKTVNGLAEVVVDATVSDFNPEQMDIISCHSIGYFNGGYMYSLNRTISVGGFVGYSKADMTVAEEDVNIVQRRYDMSLLYIMGTIKANWFQRKHFGMYSKAGIGSQYMRVKTSDGSYNGWSIIPSIQISAVGLEAGGRVRAFLEIGGGFQGFLQGGIKCYL